MFSIPVYAATAPAVILKLNPVMAEYENKNDFEIYAGAAASAPAVLICGTASVITSVIVSPIVYAGDIMNDDIAKKETSSFLNNFNPITVKTSEIYRFALIKYKNTDEFLKIKDPATSKIYIFRKK